MNWNKPNRREEQKWTIKKMSKIWISSSFFKTQKTNERKNKQKKLKIKFNELFFQSTQKLFYNNQCESDQNVCGIETEFIKQKIINN
jgi:hypothetical protein